jgi:hypothetical protein
MKNLLFFFLIFPILIISSPLNAQQPCEGTYKEYYLNSNNIRASFFPRGNKFTNTEEGRFLVPYSANSSLSTIFSSMPWVGGFDDALNLKVATETYPAIGNIDFIVGPLDSIGLPFESICDGFDFAWTVFIEDIQAHRLDFETDGVIDDTIHAVFGWPALGNKFFSSYYGFEMPSYGQGYAPFHDYNSNDIYDPENGDYPNVRLSGTEYIPDQILWMVFNDVEVFNFLDHDPLRFEFQLTAFAFHCQDNEMLNNTIFNSYKIINRAVTAADSVFFGMWTDYDLGCAADDFAGSDSTRSTEFVYNSDIQDGSTGSDCPGGTETYDVPAPVQSMTYLSHPMHSFIEYDTAELSIEIYRSLNGEWSDGTPMRPENDGHGINPQLGTTKFLYHGDPRDPASWSEINVFNSGHDTKNVSSVYIGRMDPGAIRVVESAYMFHHDPQAGHLDQITTMFNNVDALLSTVDDIDGNCMPFPICQDDDCVWPGDFDKNGIADYRDYLMWGVMNGSSGPERNGLISWRGHFAEDWTTNINGVNAKHGDGDGNGIVDFDDIDINYENFLLTNENYTEQIIYREGPEIIMSADPIEPSGRVRNFQVRMNRDLDNVLGMTFELEFDTSLFNRTNLVSNWTGDTAHFQYTSGFMPDDFLRVTHVQINNIGVSLDSNDVLMRSLGTGFQLKTGLPMPDSTIIRLRNLKAITPDGTDLQIGSETLVVYREGFVSTFEPNEDPIKIYPNPATDQFWIDTENPVKIEILNSLGTRMKAITVSGNDPVDVSGYPAGVYFLRFSGHLKAYKLVVY